MQGNPGKGSIKEYTPDNIKKTLEEFVEKGSGQFSADDVKKALEKLGGSVEEGIKKMSENVKKMSKAVPGWAPDRKDMPVIEPNEVPEAAKLLNEGKVNWNLPLAQKEAVLKLASLLPKGSQDRRVLLARMAGSKTAMPGEVGVTEVNEVLSELIVGQGWDPSGVRDLEKNALGLARTSGKAVLNGIKEWISSQDSPTPGMGAALYAISKIERRAGVKILGHDQDEAGYIILLLNNAYLA